MIVVPQKSKNLSPKHAPKAMFMRYVLILCGKKGCESVESFWRFSSRGTFIQVIRSLFNFVMFYISQKAKTVKKVSPSQNLGLPIFGPRTAEVKEVKEEKDRPWVVQSATKIMWEFVLWFEGFHRRRKSKKLEQSCWFESMLCFLRVKNKMETTNPNVHTFK